MRHRTLVAVVASALTVGAGLGLVSPASAHSPVVTGSTVCRVDSWTVTWTVRADSVRGLTWWVTSPAGYAPVGSQPDSAAFTRTATYPAGQASATETVGAAWSNQVTGSYSATVARPPLCDTDGDIPTTTVAATTTTVEATTTTVEATTTTTTAAPASSVVQDSTTSSVVQASTTDPAVVTLPATGASSARPMLRVVLLLFGLGAAMVAFTRRRRLN